MKELCDDLFFSRIPRTISCQTPRGQVSSSSISFVSVRLTKKTSTFIDFFRDLLKVAPLPPLPPYRRSKALLIQVEGAKKVIPRDPSRSRAIPRNPNGPGGARVRDSWRTSQGRGFTAPTRYSKRRKPSHSHPRIEFYEETI